MKYAEPTACFEADRFREGFRVGEQLPVLAFPRSPRESFPMPRQVRIEDEGALYLVMVRVNWRRGGRRSSVFANFRQRVSRSWSVSSSELSCGVVREHGDFPIPSHPVRDPGGETHWQCAGRGFLPPFSALHRVPDPTARAHWTVLSLPRGVARRAEPGPRGLHRRMVPPGRSAIARGFSQVDVTNWAVPRHHPLEYSESAFQSNPEP